MKKIVRLTEKDITNMVKRVINEDLSDRKSDLYSSINRLIDREFDDVETSDVVEVLNNILDSHKGRSYRQKKGMKPISKDEVVAWHKDYPNGKTITHCSLVVHHMSRVHANTVHAQILGAVRTDCEEAF